MKPPAKPHGLMCHYFHGGVHKPTQGSLSADDFCRLLDAYGHRMLPAATWLDWWYHGHLIDHAVVTIDDGLREALDVALPVLEERGLTAAWNVPTLPLVGVPLAQEVYRWVRNQFATMDAFYDAVAAAAGPSAVGFTFDPEKSAGYLADYGYLTIRDRGFRYWRDGSMFGEYERAMARVMLAHGLTSPIDTSHWLSASDLRALRAAGHVIGFHTHSHPTSLTRLSREQQANEYATSKWILETILGEKVTTMSHPNGNVTAYGLDWLRDHGITFAWNATMKGTLPHQAPRWSSGNWTR